MYNAISKSKIKDLYFITDQMKKFKLAKEKWYFQSLRETKSVKELDDWAVEISWYASTKDKDRWWDIVEPKAFQSALERYMTNPIVLLQHKTDKPIGIVEEADIDDNWLRIKAKISQNTDWVVDLIKNWVLRAFSIWYSIKDYETDVRELADWTYDMTNIIKDLELYEISVVSIPMNPYALSKSVEDLLEVEEVDDEENIEEEKVEESETVEEWKDDIKEEEKSVDNWNENDQNDEEVVEWDNVQDEEKTDESETEETEESENTVDDKKEEHPNEEVETKEMNEEKNENVEHSNVVDLWAEENEAEMHIESENNENKTDSDDESVNSEADEKSEIDEESVEQDSENAVETQTNDEEVVETHNDEIVETKSIETESQKQFDFESKIEQLQKSFDEKLSIKEEKIKELESKVEKMTQLFADSIDTIDRMATNVKNTPVNSGLQYKRPLKKWWYYDVASIIKSL